MMTVFFFSLFFLPCLAQPIKTVLAFADIENIELSPSLSSFCSNDQGPCLRGGISSLIWAFSQIPSEGNFFSGSFGVSECTTGNCPETHLSALTAVSALAADAVLVPSGDLSSAGARALEEAIAMSSAHWLAANLAEGQSLWLGNSAKFPFAPGSNSSGSLLAGRLASLGVAAPQAPRAGRFVASPEGAVNGDFVWKKAQSGMKVCVSGLVYGSVWIEAGAGKACTSCTPQFVRVSFLDLSARIKEVLDAMDAADCDMNVVMSDLGIDRETQLVLENPRIDLVLGAGGAADSPFSELVGNTTWIVHPGSEGRFVASVEAWIPSKDARELAFNISFVPADPLTAPWAEWPRAQESPTTSTLTSTSTSNSDLSRLLRELEAARLADELLEASGDHGRYGVAAYAVRVAQAIDNLYTANDRTKVIGSFVSQYTTRNAYTRTIPVGNLLADATRAALLTDIALVGPAALASHRQVLEIPEFSFLDLLANNPSRNYPLAMPMEGRTLYAWVKRMVQDPTAGLFMQMSGLQASWSYDVNGHLQLSLEYIPEHRRGAIGQPPSFLLDDAQRSSPHLQTMQRFAAASPGRTLPGTKLARIPITANSTMVFSVGLLEADVFSTAEGVQAVLDGFALVCPVMSPLMVWCPRGEHRCTEKVNICTKANPQAADSSPWVERVPETLCGDFTPFSPDSASPLSPARSSLRSRQSNSPRGDEAPQCVVNHPCLARYAAGKASATPARCDVCVHVGSSLSCPVVIEIDETVSPRAAQRIPSYTVIPAAGSPSRLSLKNPKRDGLILGVVAAVAVAIIAAMFAVSHAVERRAKRLDQRLLNSGDVSD